MTDEEAVKLWACLKVLWPGENRLPEGWQRRWREHFENASVETVCEALRSISDKSDPIRPTLDMVDEWLGRWAIVTPGLRRIGVPATPEQEAEMRERSRMALEGDAEVDAYCEAMPDEEFDAIAKQILPTLMPALRELIVSRRRPLKRSRVLRREVFKIKQTLFAKK